jgi:hypothetical protein
MGDGTCIFCGTFTWKVRLNHGTAICPASGSALCMSNLIAYACCTTACCVAQDVTSTGHQQTLHEHIAACSAAAVRQLGCWSVVVGSKRLTGTVRSCSAQVLQYLLKVAATDCKTFTQSSCVGASAASVKYMQSACTQQQTEQPHCVSRHDESKAHSAARCGCKMAMA